MQRIIIKKVKGQPIKWEKKFANHLSDKGLPPRITATTQHKDNPIKTRATDISAKQI